MNPSAGDFPITQNQFWNGFNQGAQGVGAGIDSYNNLIQAQFKKAQLPYAAQLAQADVASKMAYSQLMGPQFLAKLAGNKDILANMDNPKALVDALVARGFSTTQAGQIATGIYGGGSNPTINQPSPQPTSDQITDQIKKMKPGQAVVNTSGQPVNIPTDNRSSIQTYGDNSPKNTFWKNVGKASGAEEQGKTQGALFTSQWGDLDKNTSDAANEQSDLLRNADRFNVAYNNLNPLEKGAFFGKLPAISSNAQIADNASDSMMVAVARALQQGHITNSDFSIFSKLKSNRGLNKGAEEGILPFIQGAAYRSNERLQFNSVAKSLGLSAPETNTIWNRYINDKPFFDPKTNKIVGKNMDSWDNYLKPARIKNILSRKEKSNISYNSGNKITKRWKFQNGQLVEG